MGRISRPRRTFLGAFFDVPAPERKGENPTVEEHEAQGSIGRTIRGNTVGEQRILLWSKALESTGDGNGRRARTVVTRKSCNRGASSEGCEPRRWGRRH
jgi:hypothetical protein